MVLRLSGYVCVKGSPRCKVVSGGSVRVIRCFVMTFRICYSAAPASASIEFLNRRVPPISQVKKYRSLP